MNTNKQTRAVFPFAAVAMAGFALTTTHIHSQELLAVDFGAAGAESGFIEQSNTNTTHTTTAGDITVALSGVQGIFNFATSGSNDLFYRDFYFKNGGTMTLTLTGPGISANTSYDLTFWAFYGAQARDTTINGTAGTTGPSLGPIAYEINPTSLSQNAASGTYTSDGTANLTFLIGGTGNRPALNGFKIVGSGPDTTPPTLASGNIVDDKAGGPVAQGSLVTYTVTFSEDMDDGTVSSGDFDNAASSNINIGTVTETAPGVFSVPVTPTDAGTLQLRVPIGAVLDDAAGNPLNTSSAILDDTTLTVTTPDTTDPTLSPGDIVDNKGGGSVNANTLVTYTVTFSEDMDAGTVDAADFGNAGSSTISIGTISEPAPGVFTVPVTPTDAGTLQLEIVDGAILTDPSGNPLDTTPAIVDGTTLTVNVAIAGPIAASGWNTDFILGNGETYAAHEKPVNAAIWFSEDSTVGFAGVPASGAVTAAGKDFQFQPYGGGTDNCVRGDNVTLTLVTPAKFGELSLLGSAPGSGGSMVLQFADGSSTGSIPLSFSAWNGPGDLSPGLTWDGTTSSQPGGMSVFVYALSASDQSKTLETILFGGGGGKTVFALSGGPDLTAPTLAGSDIVDEGGGAPVAQDHQVIYTVSFNEGIDPATVSTADFGNAGTSSVHFGALTELGPGVFRVEVTPTSAGTLRLQIPVGASIADQSGNSLVTGVAILDDTTITVTAAAPDTTAPSPDPMTFALAPYASSATSISMEVSPALDTAGIEFYFTETSGNSGGDDSGWQHSRSYVDTGLTTGLQYTYTVSARDLSANQNTSAPSAPASSIAETPANPPAVITLTGPTSRHIVQRSASNVGAIGISGTYTNTPDTIEARAVVMWGSSNSGTTTAWQTIEASPGGANFSGTLSGVPAGGWYQVEVRGVSGGVTGGIAVQTKIGVGDIFVTAGQSNSANHSPGGYIPSDDRVSARNATTGSTWVFAVDPIPIASGTGGSIWTRLGDQLATTLDLPIGFIAVGVGGTAVGSWVPGSGNYNNRLRPAVQSLPVNGFRAGLWHQGETDTVGGGTSAADYASRLSSMISQSRIDAGWGIPWYIAEASWHSNGPQNQERVVAGQRMAAHGDPLTFLGETTDDMHLKGSGLHFDIPRQLERSQQYTDILAGTPTLTPVNGHFEDNRDPAVTGLSPLADGVSELVVITDNNTRRPIGWRILAASGIDAADGANGYHNPSSGTFAGAVDTVNGGVLPNMDGKHVALLDDGSADNYFLHSTRALAEADTIYTLTVALGVRDNPASFGTARLEITADGVVVASASFDKAALDTLHGSDASGTFTDASISWATGGTVAANQPLAICIVKEGGAGTVLDFDKARLTAVATNDYNSWISDPAFGIDPADQDFALDPDGDRIANGLEAWFGTHPGEFNAGLAGLATAGTTTTFTHPHNASPPSDLSGFYQWSPNLNDWFGGDGVDGPPGGPTVTLVPNTVGITTTVTATASEALDSLFLRVGVMQN